mgnify:CR=1 FL=1
MEKGLLEMVVGKKQVHILKDMLKKLVPVTNLTMIINS